MRMKLFTKLWTTLLLLCVAGVANATEYEIDQRFSSVAEIGDQLFVIANETDGKAIYNKDAQNLAYNTYAEAMAGTSHLWKLHSLADEADPEIQSCYTLEAVTADGTSIGLWGNPAIYLNSGAEGGFDGCFVLGFNDQYGQDVKYGAVWEVEYVEGKGFALKNKARGGYFAGTAPAPTGEEPIYWTFGTLKEGGDEPIVGIQTLLEQDFTADQGDFTINDVTLGEGLTYVWKQDAKFGMKASAYANKTNIESESWLLSPEISLQTMAKTELTFSHAISKFFGDVTTEATLWVREVGGEWKQFEISYPEVPEGKSYSDFADVTIDLSEFNGKKIQVGFKYTSTSDAAGTWEIKTFKIAGVMGNPNPEPERVLADGKYYIANISASMALAPAFWGAGNSWGTQASLVKHPEYVILSMLPDGTYTMESQVSNGGENYYFGENGYMDANPAAPLTLTKVRTEFKKENGEPVDFYTITSGEKIFGWDGETTVLANNLTADSDKALWLIATEEEALEGLKGATKQDPMDATFLFLDPGFGRNNRNKSAWVSAVEGDSFNVGGDNTNMNAEKWGGNSQTFDFSQTAEVPNGVYQISWNGFYRYNNTADNTNDIAIAAHADGTEVINSFIYINGEDYPLTSIADEEATAALAAVEKNIPFSQTEASAAFGMGLYAQSATVTVTDGKLTIGIKKTEHPGTDWTVWDNFEIYYLGAPASHTWDFTKWSEATITNLKAEAAKVTVTADPDKEGNTLCTDNGALWSDHEKAEGKTCDTYAASKDNCFWAMDEESELTANGAAIAELKGLQFDPEYAKGRGLAIAVNYPETSLGTYNGPAYLWLGGKDKTCFTIPSVKGGSIIKIGVESHKASDARGVQLFVGETQLTDPEGNAVAAPKTYTEQTWQVPAGDAVDVIVKNTNGCHIYFIDATIADEELAAAPEGWHSVISNGNLAGEENVNFYTKENSGDPMLGTIVDGAGKNGTRGLIVNTPDNPGTDWDAQFFIKSDENIPAGYKIHVEFDYMATQEAGFDTQCHAAPGDYIHWYCVESYTAKPEWQHMSKEVEVSAAKQDDNGNWNGEWGKACTNEANGKPFQTVAFNLSKVKTATTFHFDNIIFWVSDFDTSVKEIKAVNADKQGVIYNLRGQKMNGALQKGIYIQDGKKFVVK